MSVLGLLLLQWCFLLSSKTDAQFSARGGRNVPEGYLPPPPDDPMCLPETHYETVTSTRTILATFTPDVPDRTTTILSTEYRPTTVYSTDLSTIYSTSNVGQTQTVRRDVVSTRVTTIGGIPVTRTVSTTLVSFVQETQTDYDTFKSVVHVTSTTVDVDETTVVIPTTVVRTFVSTQYRTVPVYEDDVTLTNTATTTIYSTFQNRLPDRTELVTRTQFSTAYETEYVTVPARKITQYITSTVPNVVTRTTTAVNTITSTIQSTSYIDETRVVTNTRFETRTSTHAVTQTRQITDYQTSFQTQTRFSTNYEAEVTYTTIEQPDVVRTSTQRRVETVTGEGGLRVVTSSRFTTSFDQRTTTVSRGGSTVFITATRTIQDDCGPTGYNYEAPSIPFGF